MANLKNILYAGDTVAWSFDYDKDGTISYYFNKSDNTFNVSATEKTGERTFKHKIPETDKIAGDYTFQVVIEDNGEKQTIQTGSVTIKQSFKSGVPINEKIFEEELLEKIEEYLKNPNAISAQQTEYDGKKLYRYEIKDLIAIRDKLKNTIQIHYDRVKRQQGHKTYNSILRLKV